MSRWLAMRVIQSVGTVIAVITLSFGLVRLLPGGPIDQLRAKLIQQGSDPARAEQLAAAYSNVAPQEPLHIQYINYLVSMLQGDFGTSTRYTAPVEDILLGALPWTVFVMSISLILIYLIAIVFGAVMAYYEGTWIDYAGTSLSVVTASVPFYIAAILFIYVLGYNLSWFPTSGYYGAAVEPGFNIAFFTSVLHHSTLLVVSVVLTGFGSQSIAMRGNTVRILGADYLKVAELRGLSWSRISTRYLARNAVLPMYTMFVISIGFMFGGSVVLEEIFQYPGVGYYMFKAINARDYPLMMGAFIIITVAVVICLFIADLTYGKIDPRTKTGGERESY